MKRKKGLSRRRKGPAGAAKAKADKAWADAVKERAKNRCEICGNSDRLHAHHVAPRTYHRLRFDVRNGVALCMKHHLFGATSAHKDALWFAEWFKSVRPDDYEHVMAHENRKPINRSAADYQELCAELKEAA